MSYILDALRRAEAERGRGAVPGLHSQAALTTGAAPADRAEFSLAWVVAALAVGFAAVAAGGAWWALQRQAPPVAVAVPMAAAPAALPASAPVTAPVPAPVPASVPAVVSEPPAAVSAPSAPREAEPRTPAPRERARPAPAPAAREVAPAPALRPQPAKVAEPAPAAAPASPVFAQGDLPESVRAQLPALKVTGATHSSNPLYRMAIVNGQVLHEGDQAAPGLVLETIEPGRTVWSFRGYRYAVAAAQ